MLRAKKRRTRQKARQGKAAKDRSVSLAVLTRKLAGAKLYYRHLAKDPAKMGPSLKRQELWI